MTTWYANGQFDSVFFISAGTLISALLGLCLRICYKTRCRHVKICCGLLEFERPALEDPIPSPSPRGAQAGAADSGVSAKLDADSSNTGNTTINLGRNYSRGLSFNRI